jgi:hypothetical protein
MLVDTTRTVSHLSLLHLPFLPSFTFTFAYTPHVFHDSYEILHPDCFRSYLLRSLDRAQHNSCFELSGAIASIQLGTTVPAVE